MIAEFRIPAADTLSVNAGTPRCLGMTAVLVRKPAGDVYSTAGLDPRGRLAVHQYAACNGRELCLVHMSVPTLFGDDSPALRHCPANAECITLTEDSDRQESRVEKWP
jgi:hypothetical protein